MTSPQLIKKIGLKQNPGVTDENCFIISDNFVIKEEMLVVPSNYKQSDIAIIDGTSQLDPCKSYANIKCLVILDRQPNGRIHHPKSSCK